VRRTDVQTLYEHIALIRACLCAGSQLVLASGTPPPAHGERQV